MNRKQKHHRPKGKSTTLLQPLHKALFDNQSVGNIYHELFHNGKVLTPTIQSFNKLVEDIKPFASIDSKKREKIEVTLEKIENKVSKKGKFLYTDLNKELKELLHSLHH